MKPHQGSEKYIALDDLKDTDVVFGTRGNGGNASFIRTLEEKAVLYTQLSKFEKMACIKKLINDWAGRFFMLEPDGNCSVVRDSSPSSKLYTSVRRMMNYVVKKNETSDGPRQGQRKKREIQKIKPIRQVSAGSDRTTSSPARSKTMKRLATVTPELQREREFTQTEPLNTNAITRLEEAAICTLATLSSGVCR
jgi:hypothetical protein